MPRLLWIYYEQKLKHHQQPFTTQSWLPKTLVFAPRRGENISSQLNSSAQSQDMLPLFSGYSCPFLVSLLGRPYTLTGWYHAIWWPCYCRYSDLFPVYALKYCLYRFLSSFICWIFGISIGQLTRQWSLCPCHRESCVFSYSIDLLSTFFLTSNEVVKVHHVFFLPMYDYKDVGFDVA